MKVDGVFEGGGVKGIALVGAIAETEARGYQFENVAGTSAGAIVASLIAAGYTAAELKEIIGALDYEKFKDKSMLDRIPLIGPAISLGLEKGIYEGNYFEDWIRDLLVEKGVSTFGDLVIEEYKDDPRFRYRLQVVASDISRGRMLVLPHDIKDYGFDPDKFEVARAIRMSMSIPFFFEPVVLEDSSANSYYIVDGGILSNFPVEVLDDGSSQPAWPTLGYKLVDPQESRPHSIHGPLSLFGALFATMMEAHDARYIQEKDFARTIPIPTGDVRTTDFDISQEQVQWLYESGLKAAKDFFDGWDFDSYKKKYRQGPAAGRRASLRLPKAGGAGGV
jgi:NTE family protein